MRKYYLVMIIVVLLMTVSLVGCAQSNESNLTSENTSELDQLIEPCQLISKSEAEELLGKALTDPEKADNAVVGQKICFYDSLSDDAEGFLEVNLTQQAFMESDGLTSRFLFDSIKENFEDEFIEIDGIGDEAFIATPGIHILKGEYYIVIGVGDSSDETNRVILKAAGKKAVGNLESLIN